MKRVFVLLVGSVATIASVQAGGPSTAAVPTFAKDVAPIVFNNCSLCHRSGTRYGRGPR